MWSKNGIVRGRSFGPLWGLGMRAHLSDSPNSLKGLHRGGLQGVAKVDTRSLDHSACVSKRG